MEHELQSTLRALAELLPRTVRVRGEGEIDATPDAATISVGIFVSKTNLAKAQAEAAKLTGAVLRDMKAAGVPDRDIQTRGYAIYPQRNHDAKGKPATIVGYDVRNTVVATVRDLTKLPAVLDAATAAGANEVSGPAFFIQHPEELEDRARQLAIRDARRQAEVLAAEAGATLGRVRSIATHPSLGSYPTPRYARAGVAFKLGAETPIEAGTERVAANVEVVWELA